MPLISSVFDTNIYLQAILSDQGPAYGCIRLALDDAIRLFVTEEIIEEVHRVVTRPAFTAKYPQLRGDQPSLIVSSILEKASVVAAPRQSFVFERDPADEVFINLALETGAGFLVSRDKDLLDLGNDLEFSSNYSHLRIVSPVEFLKVVRAK